MEIVIVSKADLQELITDSIRSNLSTVDVNSAQSSDTSAEEWLTNADAREHLSLSKTTLQRFRKSGQLPFSKIGGSIYYRRSDIDSLLERNMRPSVVEVSDAFHSGRY